MMVVPPRHVVSVYVSVPVACFRAPQAREYLETLPVPPPSTVYGMLLSLVGEPDRLRHIGAELAVALVGEREPARSTVLRTAWRIKDARVPLGLGNNKRPDFQELLTGVALAVFVRPGVSETARPSLAVRLASALDDPASVRRFGGLSLGESTHLVDEVRRLRPGDLARARRLVSDPAGDLTLPIWPDHVGSAGTHWGQFALAEWLPAEPVAGPPEDSWVAVRPPGHAASG